MKEATKMRKKRDVFEQRTYSRRLVRRRELVLALVVLAACAGFYTARFFGGKPGAAAWIYLGSDMIREVPLRQGDHYRIDLMDEYGIPVSFEVKDGAIRFVDVTCPDHICEKTGFISTDGQSAVCMPNRVAAHIVSE